MKGILFTELVEMIEARWSPALADRVLLDAALPNSGAYTAVARYPAAEWLRIVGILSGETGVPGPELVRGFGEYLFGRFGVLYPELLHGANDSFALFERVDGYIHVEERKLHPDAELPGFSCERRADGVFVMDYASPRPMADLAEGLMRGAFAHFQERVQLTREDAPGGPPFRTRFEMRRAGTTA